LPIRRAVRLARRMPPSRAAIRRPASRRADDGEDAWEVAGVPSTGGKLGRAGYIPQHDATVIQRMRAAGAIPIGMTNLPEMSMAFESDNLVHGRTNNPYDLARTPGGSGGGGRGSYRCGD